MNSRGKVARRVALGPAKRKEGAKAEEYRRRAQAHAREAALSHSPEMRELQLRLVQSYLALAENEEWLEGKLPPGASVEA